MSKSMLVNVTHVEESRVAILDDGVLSAYEIETINRTNIKGNIYNAVIDTVMPSLEASFLKIAPDLKGFLPLDQVNFRLLPPRGEKGKFGKIGQHLHSSQKIMAQVVREPFAGKPPTVSTYFSLPGRFLVLMPGVDSSGVSRKIEDSAQRERLKKIVEELNPPEGFGVIVRTAGLGQTKAELQRDLRYLLRLWESIQRASQTTDFPGLVYREADLVIRTIRDHLTADIKEVWIDSEEMYEKALAFVRDVMPTRAKILKLHKGDRPLFNKFNLEEQIERIYKRRVPLPSGGEIVIDGTEALTAIDVNTARSKRKGGAEENSLQTNLEAAGEIARQLRLRDLGGLIVIDFIDMMAARNRAQVEKAMREALKGDPAKHDITRLSKLGLMELARQRIKGAKLAASYATCAVCDGYGLVKNVEAAALAALRKLQTRSARGDFGKLRLALPAEVATWLANHKRDELTRIERRHGISIEILPSPTLLRHDSEFELVPRDKADESAGRGPEERAVPLAEAAPAESAPAAEASRKDGPVAEIAAEEAPREERPREERPRRGRRRRGKGERTAAAEDGGSAAVAAEETTEASETGASSAGRAPDAKKEVAAEETEASGERPRRRRRRRRRGKASQPSGNGEPAAVDNRTPDLPPPTVRSDELMPAATGAAQRREARQRSAGARRRRASGGGRGPVED